jgi:uncharacterized protein (DUF305 family)
MRTRLHVVLAAMLSTVGAARAGPGDATDPATYEIDFMTEMIDHHQMGIEMAEPCVDGATHDDLRRLCDGIVTTQTAEIGQMREWLRAWYATDHEPSSGRMMTAMVERLWSLSGDPLEITFMRMMIPHHLQAVRDADFCTTAAQHQELRELCAGIVATQSEEVESMRGWLCDWYGLCGGCMGPSGGPGGGGGMGPMGGGTGGRSR